MSFGCPGGPPLGFWLRLGRLHFKSRRQRSERQSAERFYAAASQRSYRRKGRGVMISARAADLPSRRRKSFHRRSNSNSTRPRSLYPWRRAGPRSCAGRRSAGAVIPGLRARARASSLASSLKACFESAFRSCRFAPPSCVRVVQKAVASLAGSSGTRLRASRRAWRRLTCALPYCNCMPRLGLTSSHSRARPEKNSATQERGSGTRPNHPSDDA